MNVYTMNAPPFFYENIPMVDAEFDRFEMNRDFELVLREAETATFYHNALNQEE